MLVHTDDLGGMNDGDAQCLKIHIAKLRMDLLLIADQHNLAVKFLCCVHRAAYNLLGCKISAHRIDRYTHPALPSPNFYYCCKDTTINFARKTSLSSR